MKLLKQFGCSNDNTVECLWKTDDGRLLYGYCWDNLANDINEEDIELPVVINKQIVALMQDWHTNRLKLPYNSCEYVSDQNTLRFQYKGHDRHMHKSVVKKLLDIL